MAASVRVAPGKRLVSLVTKCCLRELETDSGHLSFLLLKSWICSSVLVLACSSARHCTLKKVKLEFFQVFAVGNLLDWGVRFKKVFTFLPAALSSILNESTAAGKFLIRRRSHDDPPLILKLNCSSPHGILEETQLEE